MWFLLVSIFWWIRFLRICERRHFPRHDCQTNSTWSRPRAKFNWLLNWTSTEILLKSWVTFPILFIHKLRHWARDPQSYWTLVKDQFYLGLGKIKIPWKIVNNGTKQYVILKLSVFFLCHSSFDKQCFSVVSWLIVAVSQYFVALHAQHFPSRFAYAQLEEKCWAFRQQNIVTRLQWALIQLRNIAYSHKEWQRKNSDNFNITIVIER